MRILFQGDSVTDAGRNREDLLDLGPGYPSVTAQRLRDAFPELDFTFYNKGISGNRTDNLVARLQEDFLDLEPDLVTILIGVNDSWHRMDAPFIDTTEEMTEANYRAVLESLKERKIPIVILEPFALPTEKTAVFRADLNNKIDVIRKLAREYAVAYIPLDGLAAANAVQNGPLYLANDGIHPNQTGIEWLGNILAETLIPIIKKYICA